MKLLLSVWIMCYSLPLYGVKLDIDDVDIEFGEHSAKLYQCDMRYAVAFLLDDLRPELSVLVG
ncbi:MAG: hypothetical protein AB8B79_20680 [Granulosicoccus sp.]